MSMCYNSFNFVIIFPVVFALYYCIPARYNRVRNVFLLLTSYLIYLNYKPAFALVLFGVTLVSYVFGISMERVGARRKYHLVWCGILMTIVPLLTFKYYNFVNSSVTQVLDSIGLKMNMPGLNWAIPVGISFFTFQAVGYVQDVYYRRFHAERDLLNYMLFLSFFPSLTSGPINRAPALIPQFRRQRCYFDYPKAVAGLKMLLWGMVMKVVVADRVGLYVDTIYEDYSSYSGLSCLIASVMYSVQIYADFAGYSLMAIGTAKILGFDLAENFRRPYFSVSVTDFWRRWHISLSSWLRDYVYIPLGGSRRGKGRTYWNIFVTFFVSGLWHGANWTFIVWGLWHGVFLIAEKFLGMNKLQTGGNIWLRLGRIAVTFMIVTLAWVVFRMPHLAEAAGVIGKILTMDSRGDFFIPDHRNTFFILAGLFMLMFKDVTDEFWTDRMPIFDSCHRWFRWTAYVLALAMILLAGVLDAGQFIYAKF